MQKLKIDMESCYGIKKLNAEFDFAKCNVAAIYASNGAIKSALANTFQALADGKAPQDRFFPDRATTCAIVDETGAPIKAAEILFVRPYDESFGHTAKTSAQLVNTTLRVEYEKLHAELETTKAEFLKALKATSGSKRDLEAEISAAFTPTGDQFYKALARVTAEVVGQSDAPFENVEYDRLFDEKSIAILDQNIQNM
jgi:hypothetical protein